MIQQTRRNTNEDQYEIKPSHPVNTHSPAGLGENNNEISEIETDYRVEEINEPVQSSLQPYHDTDSLQDQAEEEKRREMAGMTLKYFKLT